MRFRMPSSSLSQTAVLMHQIGSHLPIAPNANRHFKNGVNKMQSNSDCPPTRHAIIHPLFAALGRRMDIQHFRNHGLVAFHKNLLRNRESAADPLT